MPTLSILHLSDLHFINSQQWRPLGHHPAQASALAEFAAFNKNEFHVIFVSGDLAETGRRRHLEAAHRFLFAKVASTPSPGSTSTSPYHADDGKPTLQGAECDIYLSPGNHDRYFDWRGDPGSGVFDDVFKAHWKRGIGGVQAHIIPVPNSKYRVALISADCCLRDHKDAFPQRPDTVWGQGRVYTRPGDDVVERLAAATKAARALPHDLVVVVWAIHFPPTDEATIPQRLRLLNCDKILELAEKLNVRLIMSGHIHDQEAFRPRTNGPTIWTAGTATARWFRSTPGGHTAHIVDITVGERGPRRVAVSRRNFAFTTWGKHRFTETTPWKKGLRPSGLSWDE